MHSQTILRPIVKKRLILPFLALKLSFLASKLSFFWPWNSHFWPRNCHFWPQNCHFWPRISHFWPQNNLFVYGLLNLASKLPLLASKPGSLLPWTARTASKILRPDTWPPGDAQPRPAASARPSCSGGTIPGLEGRKETFCVWFTELGTFSIFYFFNNKKWFFCILYKVITYFCTSPI